MTLFLSEVLPADVLYSKEVFDALEPYLKEKLGDEDWILRIANYQIYLNRVLLAEKNISIDQVFDLTREFLLEKEGVYNVVNLHNLSDASVPDRYLELIRNGRSEERRVGKECVGTCRSRWSPYHKQ